MRQAVNQLLDWLAWLPKRHRNSLASPMHLFKHTDYMASVVLDAAVGNHLKTAVDDRPVDQVISNKVHVV